MSKEIQIEHKLLEQFTIRLEYLEEDNKYHGNKFNSNILEDISLEMSYEISRHIYKDLIS